MGSVISNDDYNNCLQYSFKIDQVSSSGSKAKA